MKGTLIKNASVSVLLTLLPFASNVVATEWRGDAKAGYWFLLSNASDQEGFLENDGYGQSYIDDSYSLLQLGLSLRGQNLSEFESGSKLHANLKARSLIRLTEGNYTLGVNDRARNEIRVANLELEKIGGRVDLWLGRNIVFEAGGIGVDGVTALYHLNNEWSLGAFGGLGADPRNFTGYIGSSYRKNPIQTKLMTFGSFGRIRKPNWTNDFGVSALLFEGRMDRVVIYDQGNFTINPKWSLAGTVEADVAEKAQITFGNFLASYRPVQRVTNSLSFTHFRTIRFKESDLSAIPVSTLIRDSHPADAFTSIANEIEVQQDSYNILRNHMMVRVFRRNYFFGSVQFSRRTYDDRNQWKYSIGYRDPNLFATPLDFRVQLDVIDNYRGFHTGFHSMVGYEFVEVPLRLEGYSDYYNNERMVFIDNQPSTNPRQVENEYVLGLRAFYYATPKIFLMASYQFADETEATNELNLKLHEIFLEATYRFF